VTDESSRTEPWFWDDDKWRAAVARVRAGRSLKPAVWPNGARCAVALSFDPDHETITLKDGVTSPSLLSQGEYGARVGMPRILALLERHRAPATFFVPVVSSLLHPGELRACLDAGHEIGVHGWIHEYTTRLDRTTEYELMARSTDFLHKECGERPVGIRTPSWEFSSNTLEIIQELGFMYDSSLMADDEPYEVVADGEPTGLVEIPVEFVRDDAMYFGLDRATGVRPSPAARDFGQMLRDEFDRARAEGGLFQLTCHPHVIGHRSRIVVLEELLEYICSHDDVWLATHRDVATYSWTQATE
jgi:peptidoglycan/xylan/chitin deacetylase (PgdA/CDA1 family)